MELSDYLTTRQAATRYGWALSTVVRWCNQGLLRAVKIGTGPGEQVRWLIRREDAERFSPPPMGPAPGRRRRRE